MYTSDISIKRGKFLSILTKEYLNELVEKYEIPDFIKDDPVQFPHKFKKQIDIEVSGLISSCLAYGNRKKIVETLANLHEIFNDSPSEFVMNFDIDRDAELFKGFVYRYTQERDLILLIHVIGQALKEYGTLEKAFLKGFNPDDKNIRQSLTNFVNLLRSYIPCEIDSHASLRMTMKGLFHLIPSPELGSACKRLNLFLKWMVRKPPVDLNIWKNIPANKLLMPLDTHVARISRKWGLTSRNSNDWKTAEEITEKLKEFDPVDPVKYDFAIFGLGISGLA
ncbi:MAG TPA: TIGR02757 family protein [Cyanobacteria bacterium UBA9971]|nr:TIGR02757 family protein [Cyanobacteria bacterium UBA9971]